MSQIFYLEIITECMDDYLYIFDPQNNLEILTVTRGTICIPSNNGQICQMKL